MTAASLENSALLEAPDAAAAAQTPQIVRVAKTFGVSPFRQFREMISLRMGQAKLQQSEYYANGLYDPAHTMAQKREFVGVASNLALNTRLSPPDLARSNDFVGNKVLFTALIDKLGLPTTRTQAVVQNQNRFGALRTLKNAKDLKAFLLNDADFPLFGKPVNGSRSIGSASFVAVDAASNTLSMGNGRTVDLDGFCDEVIREYASGYIFQSALTQHPEMARVSGQAVGTARIVTVIEDDTPRALYALWKVPSPKAMSDNFWQDGSMLAAVDEKTGIVNRCRIGDGLDGRDINAHPESGVAFEGFQLPCWDEALRVACEAHAIFPEFGIIGWDMAITPDGPAIIECNDNPFHMLYQLANGRGINNPDFTPVFDTVAKRGAGILALMNGKS